MTERFQPLPPKALLLFSSVPNELLENIFEFYVPESITGVTQNRVWTTPTRLCLVCRRWRDIVQARPELWSVLRLTGAQLQSLNLRTDEDGDYGVPPSEEEKSGAEVLRKIKQYLQRSKLCPLSLEISIDGCSERDIPVVGPVLEMLVGSGIHASSNECLYLPNRLQEFSIHYDLWLLPHPELEGTVFPALQSLDICYNGDCIWGWGCELTFPTSPCPRLLSQLPLRCPRLRTLKWSGHDCSKLLPELQNNPPTTLTDIEIYCAISPANTFTIFSSFPKLQHCMLHGVSDFVDSWDYSEAIEDAKQPHRHIILPYLEDLTLIGTYPLRIILLRLTAPMIKHLSLISVDTHNIYSQNSVASALSAFLLRSGSWAGIQLQNDQINSRFTTHLTQFKLENIALSADEYERCLSMSPSLEVLDHYESRYPGRYSYTEPTHALLAALDRSQDRGGSSRSTSDSDSDSVIHLVCPNLRSLTLRGNILAPDGVLGHLIKMRLQDTRSVLTKIHIEFLEGSHRVDQAMLARAGAKAKAEGKEFIFKVAVCGSQKQL